MNASMSMNNDSYMLTTIDNPYNPFDSFDEWFNFDVRHGYNTCSYLELVSRIFKTKNDPFEYDDLEEAMNLIIKQDPFGLYVKVKRSFFDNDNWFNMSKKVVIDSQLVEQTV